MHGGLLILEIRKRFRSIDRKLPLLASGLVVLTSLVLAITAYVLLEHSLIDTAGRRLFGSAHAIAGMLTRPSLRVTDTAVLAAHNSLRAYARGNASRDAAL